MHFLVVQIVLIKSLILAQGDVWHEANVYLDSTMTSFKIKGYVSFGDQGNIAIDDVTLERGACPPPEDAMGTEPAGTLILSK